MPDCKYCGMPVTNGVVLHSECYAEITKRADELGEELTAAMELVHRRTAKIKALLAKDTNVPDKEVVYWIENQTTIECGKCHTEFTDEVTCCSIYGWPWNHCPKCGTRIEV